MPGRTHTQEGLPTRATEKCAMTSRTNHHAERQEQIGNMPATLSALHLRRQDASECYLAGDPIEAICREMGCSTRWLSQWKKRYEANKLTWLQERSRRPRITPTQTPAALERAIVRFRDSVSPGESRRVSAQVMREHLRRHHAASLPSRRTISHILQRHPRRCPHTQGEAKSHVAPGAQDASRNGWRA